MHHFYGIVLKLLWVSLVLTGILTMIYHYHFWSVFGIACLIVGISFVVGDIYLLRTTNHLITLAADFLLVTLLIVFAGSLTIGEGIPFSIALISSLIITIGEWPLHLYLRKHTNEIPELQ